MVMVQPTTVDEAREQAVAWLVVWQEHFSATAEKFQLTEEFRENGII